MIGISRLEKCKVQTSLSVLYNKYQLVVLQKPLYDTHSIVSCLSYRGCGLCCRNNGMGHARKTLPGFLSDKRAPICLSTVRFVLRIQGGKRLVGEAPISSYFNYNSLFDRITKFITNLCSKSVKNAHKLVVYESETGCQGDSFCRHAYPQKQICSRDFEVTLR